MRRVIDGDVHRVKTFGDRALKADSTVLHMAYMSEPSTSRTISLKSSGLIGYVLACVHSPVCVFECVVGLLKVLLAGRYTRDERGKGVASKGILG